ncbi:SRPBCC family protein [Pontibacter litorisediminis]|uniref:SRPBCC family protein n=1 Tax=Pontibacter litorisediminis TaxID=1846260 RepID=UPI0023ED5B00|nr:SRPBCC family protein [Pontibacter litorisediminis]
MPTIILETDINAPVERCFDLSRSVDLHTISTAHTGERAVAGVTSGLIGSGQTVTWRAKHFGVWQHLTSRITAFDRPHFFADEMVQGVFRHFRHEHYFQSTGSGTRMTDVFDYASPLGILGKLADSLFLRKYMHSLLLERNRVIQDYAESGKGDELLNKARADGL